MTQREPHRQYVYVDIAEAFALVRERWPWLPVEEIKLEPCWVYRGDVLIDEDFVKTWWTLGYTAKCKRWNVTVYWLGPTPEARATLVARSNESTIPATSLDILAALEQEPKRFV